MAHLHPEGIDFTTSVHIVRGDKTLLHFHKKTGQWLPFGGHIEPDEDPTQTGARETFEESGLAVRLIGGPRLPELADDPTDLPPPKHLNRHPFLSVPGHEHVDYVYYGVVVDGELRSEDGDTDIRWFTAEEVERLQMPRAVKAYALAALRELGTSPAA